MIQFTKFISKIAPAFCIASCLFISACGSAPEVKTPVMPNAKKAVAVGATEEIHLVKEGSRDSDKLVGYLGHVYMGSEENRTRLRYVYDMGFQEIGFFLDTGLTYRFNAAGEAIAVGQYTPSRAVQKLLNVEGIFRYVRIKSS